MTSHPDDDPLLRDPRFDRTWRAVSASVGCATASWRSTC